MSNFYTNVYSVITAPQIEQDEIQLADCVNALVGHIADKYRRIPIIELSPLRGNCAFYSLLALSLEQHGYGTRRYFVTANWHETFDSTPDFDEYLKKRPGTLRNTLKRKLRILNRETNHRIDINKTEQAVKAAIKDFEIVYEQSWKPEESYPCFIASIVRQLAARGKAMVGVLYVDEEPAAAQIWIEIGDHWAVFKLAYRPQFSKYSVGSVLTARMIEECLALPGTRCIDFLSGDDGYKADWVSKKAAHWGVEAINRSNPWGRLLSLKRRFGPANDTIDANLAAAAM